MNNRDDFNIDIDLRREKTKKGKKALYGQAFKEN